MAEVWKAYDSQLHRYVAIKLLHANLLADPDFVTRFTREARMVAALRHPNIVQIYDFYTPEKNQSGSNQVGTIAYMVMEYIQGQTLADYIRSTSAKKDFLSPVAIVRLFTPISLALDYAHRQGTIHRDIKPANILLDQTNTTHNSMGEPVLSDFGIAKVVGAAGQTVTGSLMGTPLYISPEQVQGQQLTNRSDLYSLAVVLYQILTGVTPFQGEALSALMIKHMMETPPAPHLVNPALSPAISELLLRALAKDPQQRYPSASAMTAAVAQAFNLPVPPELAQAVPLTDDRTIVAGATPRVTLQTGIDPASASSMPLMSDLETIPPSKSIPNPVTPYPGESSSSDTPAFTADHSPVTPLSVQDNTTSGATVLAASEVPASSMSSVEQRAPAAGSPPEPPLLAPRRQQRLRVALISLLIVVLLGSGLGAFFLLNHHTTTPTTSAVPIVFGQAYFVSTDQVSQTSGQGINDEFQINLKGIPNPPPGKSYYAWLTPDANNAEGIDLLLGKLTVSNGVVHFFYPGDGQHTNLLAITSGFLITEEDASVTPTTPTPDHTAWKYFARLPQTPAAGQTYSLLDHLRHLLANDPDLMATHLFGGLNIWAYRNVLKIYDSTQNMQNDWHSQNVTDLRHRLIETLDYLDGAQFVRQDVPADTPNVAGLPSSQIGLLEFSPTQTPPAYLSHIALHLNGVLQSPGSTTYQRTLANQIDRILSNVRDWLQQVRSDAKQLLNMNTSQLLQPSSLTLINDLSTHATSAFNGQTNASTGQTEKGVSQMYVAIQKLATFDVTAYKGS